ncbi:hypothetical protein [Alkaliphilus sp. B6464]|uniref:hypothetical protein n=1 Tax=Alkaliphilus sp. B6464 TaxID=2731219 RepID=UPI001BA55ED3|nr:hypothetical protein [Alkaliphilus sp. B6464]QUH22033.1 hypothetical protein HYG84_19195 [Alkaliphilus sp. B6464]
MSLFKKFKNTKSANYDQFYDENGFFIDNDNNTYSGNYGNYDSQNPSGMGDPNQNNDFDNNSIINKFRGDNSKTRKMSNLDNSYQDSYGQEPHLNNDYLEENPYIHKQKQSVDIKILTGIAIYVFFLIFGMLNTTFQSGYKPQIINTQIRGERSIYKQTYNTVEFIDSLDDFKGVNELQELASTGQYTTRITPLKITEKEINKKIEELNDLKLKVKDDNVLKLEMIQMAEDLLKTDLDMVQGAINYYETITGYSDLSSPQVQNMQNILLNGHSMFKNKLANYKVRFDQIRKYDLLLD